MTCKPDRSPHDRIDDLLDDIEAILGKVREQAQRLEEKGQDDDGS